ncbi:MAG: peptidylprolyl isomerase [Candidatus Berkelbacteria bacterium]|nr:peptidylprolyl isomerase [Candidatus Berkelbacteria bacterium]
MKKFQRPKNLGLKILIAFLALIVLIIFTYGLGIYKYHWSRYGVKTAIKIIPYPAAFVGPYWITMYQFDQQKSYIEHFYAQTGAIMDDESVVNQQIMDRLVEQKLVENQFKKSDLSIATSDVENEYQKIVAENEGEENVKNMLNELYGMDLQNLKILIKQKLVVDKFKSEAIVSAHVYQIVIKDQTRANDVLNQIKNGGDFTELAKKFSEDEVSKDKGGDLGLIHRGDIISEKPMAKDYEQGAFSLNPGEISPSLVQTEFGFIIFKVAEKKGTIDKSYSDWVSETKNHTKVIKFIGK